MYIKDGIIYVYTTEETENPEFVRATLSTASSIHDMRNSLLKNPGLVLEAEDIDTAIGMIIMEVTNMGIPIKIK